MRRGGALRQSEDQRDDRDGKHRRGTGAAQRQPAMVDRLVQKIADHGAKRTGQDEGGPEQRDMADRGAIIGDGEQREQRTEDDRVCEKVIVSQ